MATVPAATRFSIIMPALDEAELITSALNRLQPLRRRGHEVILIDGGSSDATVALADGLVDVSLTACKGRARQMNQGASAARGDVLIFLHADTSLPDSAETEFESLEWGSHRIWGRFDVTFDPQTRPLRVIAFFMNLRSRLSGIATGDQGMFVERSLFEHVGGFPEIALMEDVSLSKRLKDVARPVCFSSCVTTSGRKWIDHGVLRTVWLMWRLRIVFALGGDPARLAQRYYRK